MRVDNQVTLIGYLSKDPIINKTQVGSSVANFDLATNHRYTNKSGERITTTDWHKVVAFGKVAELVERTLAKGDRIALQGFITYSEWIDKHEQKRVSTKVQINTFTRLSQKTLP